MVTSSPLIRLSQGFDGQVRRIHFDGIAFFVFILVSNKVIKFLLCEDDNPRLQSDGDPGPRLIQVGQGITLASDSGPLLLTINFNHQE